MAIQLLCTNETCGKVLVVTDDFAGKLGRCPTCGTVVRIPAPAAEEPARCGDDPGIGPAPADEEIPVRRHRPERTRAFGDDAPRRRPKRYDAAVAEVIPKRRSEASYAGTIVCLCIGIGLLISLGLTPLLSMYSVTGSGHNLNGPAASHHQSAGMIELAEGKVIMVSSLLALAICVTSLVVFATAPGRTADALVAVSGCVASGWGIAALLWTAAFFWDINTVSFYEQSMQGLPEVRMLPGVGLWLGLGVSMGVTAVFSVLLSLRGKMSWLYVGEGLGLVAGVLLLVLNVQPWVAGPRIDPNDPAFTNTKLPTRYWPLRWNFDVGVPSTW
jgi:hypothetical protein